MPRLEPGAVAPAFTLLDADENPVSLSDYAGQKVIVYFYPAASTPGCTTQACNFRDELGTLKDADRFTRTLELTRRYYTDWNKGARDVFDDTQRARYQQYNYQYGGFDTL